MKGLKDFGWFRLQKQNESEMRHRVQVGGQWDDLQALRYVNVERSDTPWLQVPWKPEKSKGKFLRKPRGAFKV